MAKARIGARLAAGCLFLWGTQTIAAPPPSAADMLRFRPKQEGVVYTTPAEPEQTGCKVEPILNAKKDKTIGWLLKDKNDKVLRRFFDTTGSGKTDAWCYYNNGVEVYREIYNTPQGDQYRWLNGGGMKWGVDVNRDGKIDGWRVISAEEVSQEILLAVVKKDFARLQALMITEAELKALELPAEMAGRIRETQKNAPAKFQQTLAKLGDLGDKIRWVHLETAPPQCLPADANGMKQDLIKYSQATLTFMNEALPPDKQAIDLNLGELIQVGQAWRIIDAPVPGSAIEDRSDLPPKELQALMDELKALDDKAPKPDVSGAELVQYNLKRADVLDKIAAYYVKPDDREKREDFLRQEADCLSAAVQNTTGADRTAFQKLVALKDRVLKEAANSGLAAHLEFCVLSADYSIRLNSEKDIAKLQQEWVDKLSKFVQDYPKSEDTPDALMQLGMVNELLGKEDQSKKWYEMLIKDFPSHPHVSKARGAINRLTLDGKEFQLAGATLGSGAPFDLKSLKGKVVVVYYWASWNQQSASDFSKMKTLMTTYASKGLEVVGANLDDTPALATDFLAKNPAPGIHLYEPGGLGSKLAEPYGIQVLPTMFLIGKDGKVFSRTVQMSNLEDEVQKALK
jgi:thiol-disulfide isomerase/thioredoxin